MASVHMTLDEIIRKSKSDRPRGSGGRKGFGGKPRERSGRSFPTPASRGSGIDGKWKHDLFHEMQTVERAEKKAAKFTNKVIVRSGSGAAKDVRISVSNLPIDISDADVEEMFQPFNCQKAQVNYNADGVSLGTADVFFDRASDANKAMKEFVGSTIDGIPLKMVLLADSGVVNVASISERLSLPKAGSASRPSAGFKGGVRRGNLRSPMKGRIGKKSGGGPGGKKRGGSKDGAKGGRFLDRLADDDDFQRKERSAKKIADLDRDLDEYMAHKKATKMEE